MDGRANDDATPRDGAHRPSAHPLECIGWRLGVFGIRLDWH